MKTTFHPKNYFLQKTPVPLSTIGNILLIITTISLAVKGISTIPDHQDFKILHPAINEACNWAIYIGIVGKNLIKLCGEEETEEYIHPS